MVAVCGVLWAVGQSAMAEKAAESSTLTAEAVDFFETHIRPVLAEYCYECHSAKSGVLQAGLRLDSAQHLRVGGDSGPVIDPHQPEQSLLLSALRYETNEMPPTGKLPAAVIANFERWIEMGAPDPRDTTEEVEDETIDPRQHWAYQLPQRAAPPKVKHESAVRSELDRFVLARLEAAGLTPSPQASPRALLRRLYFDLLGLPPTAAELDEFSADPTDGRYEAVVDQLLASQHFGERWGRHWLDVARYADTKGYVFQEERNYTHAYQFRDWVIAALNTDRPFNEFVVAQLAGDQLDDPNDSAAMGFLTLGRRFLNNQNDIIDDRIDVVSRGLMGLTVACARCHDHKYDPIPTADYYSLYGVFASSEEKPRENGPPMLVDAEKPVEPVVFLRGNPGSPGAKVPRRFLGCLTSNGEPAPFQHGSGRRELAEAIASRENPLTARVWVNRVWGHLFGRSLVATPSDFGVRGMPPTHPEVLDWLACEMMEDGWSTKRLIRRIVLSSTYRQASELRAECAAIDPDNSLLWRANRRRLDLEAFRDSLLTASGTLDRTVGGPSVQLTQAPFTRRRAVYGFIERQNLPAFFRTFDFANPNTHTPERPQTTAPQQALFMMNSPFVIEQAIHLSEHSEASDAAQRISQLYLHALGRHPNSEELAEFLRFVESGDSPKPAELVRQLAWQFGWGVVDEASNTVQFQPFPSYTGAAWQGGGTLPDSSLGWAMLNTNGGHPGDSAHKTIRRWTTTMAGALHIEGVLSHPAEQGDGVRGRVIAKRQGVVGAWEVFHSEASTSLPPIAVEAGDTIDFVTDCRTSPDFDSFNWTVTLRLVANDGSVQMWDSVSDFHGPLTLPLTRWQQLAQVLLMSNEFMFVD